MKIEFDLTGKFYVVFVETLDFERQIRKIMIKMKFVERKWRKYIKYCRLSIKRHERHLWSFFQNINKQILAQWLFRAVCAIFQSVKLKHFSPIIYDCLLGKIEAHYYLPTHIHTQHHLCTHRISSQKQTAADFFWRFSFRNSNKTSIGKIEELYAQGIKKQKYLFIIHHD